MHCVKFVVLVINQYRVNTLLYVQVEAIKEAKNVFLTFKLIVLFSEFAIPSCEQVLCTPCRSRNLYHDDTIALVKHSRGKFH